MRMNKDMNIRETDMRDEQMRDRNVTDSKVPQQNKEATTQTMQRKDTERGEIDTRHGERIRPQTGAGE